MQAFEVTEFGDKKFGFSITNDFHKQNPNFVLSYSYGILAARLLGLTYPDFLRYCASHGGTIVGKNEFPHVMFKDKEAAEQICIRLNIEWAKVYNKIRESQQEKCIEIGMDFYL